MRKLSGPDIRYLIFIGVVAACPFAVIASPLFLVRILAIVALLMLAAIVCRDIFVESKKQKKAIQEAGELCEKFCDMMVSGATNTELDDFLKVNKDNDYFRSMARSARHTYALMKIYSPEQN